MHSVLAYLVMKLNQRRTMAGWLPGGVDMEIVGGNHRIQTSSFPLASMPVDNGPVATTGYEEFFLFPFFPPRGDGVQDWGGRVGEGGGRWCRWKSGCTGFSFRLALTPPTPLAFPPFFFSPPPPALCVWHPTRRHKKKKKKKKNPRHPYRQKYARAPRTQATTLLSFHRFIGFHFAYGFVSPLDWNCPHHDLFVLRGQS